MERIGLIAGVAVRPTEQGAHLPAAPAGVVTSRPVSGPALAGWAGTARLNADVVRPNDDAARLSAYARLWQQKDQAIGELQAAAERRRTLDEVDRLLNEMRQRIEGMVKNYPPFPPGSEERISYLRAISALRQQLEALTFPPEVDRAAPLPKPPPLPAEGAADDTWQAHAEELAQYSEALMRLREAIKQDLSRPPRWPEIGKALPLTEVGTDGLGRIVDGLMTSQVSLSRQGDMLNVGLI